MSARAVARGADGTRVAPSTSRASAPSPRTAAIPPGLRSRLYAAALDIPSGFGRDLSDVRVVTGAGRALGATAATDGRTIVTASAQPDRRVIAHELAHVMQFRQAPPPTGRALSHRSDAAEREAERVADVVARGGTPGPIVEPPAARVHRDDEEEQVCRPPNVGTFVLDPAIAGLSSPPRMTTHIRVSQPIGLGRGLFRDRFVALERPVRSATRILVFAVPYDQVSRQPQNSSQAAPTTSTTSVFAAGDQAYTPAGPICITQVAYPLIFTATQNSDTTAAGAVILAETDTGTVLIDGGLQLTDPSHAAGIGAELGRRVSEYTGGNAVSEAIMAPVGRDGPALPHIATQIGIRSIRATADQQQDGTVAQILEAQTRYRTWFERQLRDRLAGQRAEWESTQPIAPNNSVRDRLWEVHVDATVAAAMRERPPPRVGALVDNGGVLQASGPAATVELAPGEIPDLSGTRWERETGQQVFVYGGGRLVLSTAVLWRPVSAAAEPAAPVPSGPAPAPVPAASVLPPGPTGLAPAAPRPVNPWTLMPAVGKQGQILVRLEGTHGFLVDAGGRPAVITVAESARMAAALGGVTVDGIFPTHVHTDHVQMLEELIRRNNVRAENLIISRSWADTRVIARLRATVDPVLVGLGYGAAWTAPGIAVEGTTPVSHTRVRIGTSHVDVYALSDANRRLRQDVARERAGGSAVQSELYDSAGFVYTFGNSSSSNRAAVLGDFRGEDIIALHDALGPEGFRAAMRNVRTVFGVGHHFSTTAGRTPADIRGMELLIEATLIQNGELTIQIQSNQSFAFDGPSGRELLRYFNRQGVRVVFADRPGDPRTVGPSGAITDTAGGVTTYGSRAQIFPGDPRVVAMHRRLDMLREARRTVADSAQFGPAALALEGRTAADIVTGLDAEIGRLEGLARELRGQASADLLDVRGPEDPAGGMRPGRVAERAAFRTANTTAGRTADQVITDMAVEGPIEHALTPAVRERLRTAVQSGRSLALDVEFAAVPREVTAAMESLPQELRQSLAAKYRELAELVGRLRSEVIPPTELLDAFARVTALRSELAAALAALPDTEPNRAARTALQQELVRVDEVTTRIRANTESEVQTGRDLEGRNTRTEYIRANAAIMRAFHGIGRGLGAVMVVHSVQGLGTVARDAASGNITIPEAVLRVAHSAYGISIGVRMARQTFSQAAAGAGGVAAWEFAILAVLEIGASALANYATPEERNAAILGTALHSSVNLLCMYASMALMSAAATIPHPVARAVAMGLAFAVAFAGEPILRFFGADEAVVRWTGFPPGSVTHVQQRIDRTLAEYRVMIGAQTLAARSDESLTGVGLTPTAVRPLARTTADAAAVSVRAKERELTGLFEEAYRDSQGAHFGLEYLDRQAAEFTRLRGMALTGRDDPNRAELDRRWREMDNRLDLSNATNAVIEAMPQWSELDSRLTTLGEKLRASPMVYEEAFEAMEKAQLVLDNARYRIDSPTRGGLRPRALIPATSPAYRRYTELLYVRETRMALLYGELMRASGSPGVRLDDVSMDAPTALNRFRTIRREYDAKVTALSNQHPELARQESWATPGQMASVVVAANRLHRQGFEQLRMTELTLEAAARQLDAAVRRPESPTLTEELRRTVRAEIDGVQTAIMRRRMTLGLVFPHEVDAVVEQRSAMADRVFAAQIDVAFPAGGVRRPAPAQPLSDAELEALHSGALGGVYGSTTTTEARLAQERAILAPQRVFRLGVDRLTLSRADYDLLSRSNRQYMRLNSPYMIHDTWLFVDTYPSRTIAPGRTCIVAMAPGEMHIGMRGGILSGPIIYARVIAINPDAVAQLGTQPVHIRPFDLTVITPEEIARLAAQQPPP
jgi:hypothetical protein